MKKIIKLFTFLFIILTTINVHALSYDVEQVTNINSIKNDSKGYYFIVATNPNTGRQYAFSVKGYSPVTVTNSDGTTKTTYSLNLDNNTNEVTINSNTLNINTTNVKESLFYFVKNKNTMALGSNKYALGTANALIDDPAKIQLDLNDNDIGIVTNGKNLIIEKASNSDEFYLYRYKKDTEISYNKARYLRFYYTTNKYNSSSENNLPQNGDACYIIRYNSSTGYNEWENSNCGYTFKLYKIKNFYNIQDVKPFKADTNGELTAKKTITKDSNYSTTHLKNVHVTLNGSDVYSDSDIVVLLDNSLSLKEKYNDSIMSFVKQLLSSNKNNRVSVVKFANNIIDKDDTLSLGLTSDFDAISKIISKDSRYESGTNYSLAFETAYEFLAKDPKENRNQIVILLSDGAPTFYNKIKFSWLGDSDSKTHADNWSDYITTTSLEVVDGMKNAGIQFYSMGIEIQDKAIKADGTHILNKIDSQTVLKNIATTENNYFEISNEKEVKKGFDGLLNRMLNTARYYIKDVVVTDSVPKDYELLSIARSGKSPVIDIYTTNNNNKEILETITFIDSDTVNSSTSGEKNILSNGVVQGKYFRYDSNTQEMRLSLDEVHEPVYMEYYIYSEKYDPSYQNTMTVEYTGFNNEKNSKSITLTNKDELQNPYTYQNIYIIIFLILALGFSILYIVYIVYIKKSNLFSK